MALCCMLTCLESGFYTAVEKAVSLTFSSYDILPLHKNYFGALMTTICKPAGIHNAFLSQKSVLMGNAFSSIWLFLDHSHTPANELL